jgi:hypothetical protein
MQVFCAFSTPAKEHGFFFIKRGIFQKGQCTKGNLPGVGTISTAEKNSNIPVCDSPTEKDFWGDDLSRCMREAE